MLRTGGLNWLISIHSLQTAFKREGKAMLLVAGRSKNILLHVCIFNFLKFIPPKIQYFIFIKSQPIGQGILPWGSDK